MSRKRHGAVGMINVVVLALVVLTAAADRIQSFTDSRGIIHITNLNGANREPKTPGGSNQPATSRMGPAFPSYNLEKADLRTLQVRAKGQTL